MGGYRVGQSATWFVIAGVYGSWAALTAWGSVLPWWVTFVLGGFCLAWHGSLAHETIHGHPTRSAKLNALLGGIPLALWIPYGVYRQNHLRHHRNPELTCPIEDPESFYLTARAFGRASWWYRSLLRAHGTLLGRLILGPPVAVAHLWSSEASKFRRGDRTHAAAWGWHALGCVGVLGWVVFVCGWPLWEYLLLFVFPGLSLTLLRSYAEHRADPQVSHRTAVVEAGPIFSLLYLNNNFHVLHHREPELPWFEIQRRYRALRGELLTQNGGQIYRGYGSLLLRYGLCSREPVVHPQERGE